MREGEKKIMFLHEWVSHYDLREKIALEKESKWYRYRDKLFTYDKYY